MKFSEYLKQQLRDPKFKAAFARETNRFLKKAKKHDSRRHSAFGGVGAERQWCFECRKLVKNPDYKEEVRAMNSLRKKYLKLRK